MTKKVYIDGMSCGHCAARIEKALAQMEGVTQVKVNLAGKFAELEAPATLDEKAVLAAIDSAGYQFVRIG